MALDHLLGYVAETWEMLRTDYPIEHAFQNEEPRLTLSLSETLNRVSRKQQAGVNGSFAAEPLEPMRIGGQIVKHGRSDIRFVFGVYGAPELVLEFKKLDGSDGQRSQYLAQGVMRFVSGKYGREFAQGVMIGLARAEPRVELVAITAFIESVAGDGTYAFVADQHGLVVHQQCALAPLRAHFGTTHDRLPDAGAGPISIAHLILACPTHDGFVAPQRRRRTRVRNPA